MHVGKILTTVIPGSSTTETVTSERDASSHPWPAGVGPATRQRKVLLSLRVDPDVLAWFRTQGPGYQTRMTAVLRVYMDYTRAG